MHSSTHIWCSMCFPVLAFMCSYMGANYADKSLQFWSASDVLVCCEPALAGVQCLPENPLFLDA